MFVLGIETTCDETGVAVVEDACQAQGAMIAGRVAGTWGDVGCMSFSQIPLHERFGGVVPEIASRAHVQAITRLLERALGAAALPAPKGGGPPVELVAVAHRPGLIGSLLVGLTAAKCLALAWDVPLVGLDHIHAHIYSAALRANPP